MNIFIILISILLVAGLGSLFVNLGMDWFMTLNTPSEWVSNIVIPIVWTVIYITFAVILILLNAEPLGADTIALLVINGILNVVWCLVFFTLNSTLGGLVVIALNIVFAFYLIINLIGKNKIYGNILLIYPIWLTIATSLNLATWILN